MHQTGDIGVVGLRVIHLAGQIRRQLCDEQAVQRVVTVGSGGNVALRLLDEVTQRPGLKQAGVDAHASGRRRSRRRGLIALSIGEVSSSSKTRTGSVRRSRRCRRAMRRQRANNAAVISPQGWQARGQYAAGRRILNIRVVGINEARRLPI